MEEGNTLVNAVVGAVVSVLGSMVVPFAPLVGGAVAGYLEGGTRSDGVRVGLVSGLVALVPGALLGVLTFGLFGTFLLGMGVGFDGLALGVFGVWILVILLVGGALFAVGLSGLGGWVGNYIKYDTDVDV